MSPSHINDMLLQSEIHHSAEISGETSLKKSLKRMFKLSPVLYETVILEKQIKGHLKIS